MSRTKKRWVLALALASLVVLAGCSGSSGDAASDPDEGGYDGQAATYNAESDDSADSASESAFQAQDRALIRTGEVRLKVENFEESRRNLSRVAEDRGGFVSDSAERVRGSGNRTWVRGTLVLRVPKDEYSAALEAVKAEGEVREASTNTEDVTDQLVDVEARLENLRAQREKLRELYDEANDTENVLAVQKELSSVQSDIERLEAQRKSLRRQVQYSTITVEMAEERPNRPTREHSAWYETDLLAAFLESVSGAGVALRALAVGTAYALPYALAFGVPIVAVYGVLRRWRGRTDGVEAAEPVERDGDATSADDE